MGLKPVAAGCERSGSQWVNDDALALADIATVQLEYSAVNPAAFESAIAPHIAAEDASVRLDAGELSRHCGELLVAHRPDLAVVEGAGGWAVPLNDTESMATLAGLLGLPVVLVVGMRLGCLNHALLTADAVENCGLRLAGWVANFVAPMERAAANVSALRARLNAPCLACIPALGESPAPQLAAQHLDLDVLADG